MSAYALKGLAILTICFSCLACIQGSARGDISILGADFEYSGGSAPVSLIKPWITATFFDSGTSGTVTMILDVPNLTGAESVKDWYLNLDPTFNPQDLVFSAPTIIGSFDTPTISTQTNTYKADGDGYYDIMISFANSGGTEIIIS
jgi:hypothetical protein